MRKRRVDFKNKASNNSFYDVIEDYDLIEASFAQQYGIRLRATKMSWDEFTTLLAGLNGETPLGRIVSIRSENDPEVLKRFSKDMKRIRIEWMEKQAEKVDKKEYNQAMQNLSLMFKNFTE